MQLRSVAQALQRGEAVPGPRAKFKKLMILMRKGSETAEVCAILMIPKGSETAEVCAELDHVGYESRNEHFYVDSTRFPTSPPSRFHRSYRRVCKACYLTILPSLETDKKDKAEATSSSPLGKGSQGCISCVSTGQPILRPSL